MNTQKVIWATVFWYFETKILKFPYVLSDTKHTGHTWFWRFLPQKSNMLKDTDYKAQYIFHTVEQHITLYNKFLKQLSTLNP